MMIDNSNSKPNQITLNAIKELENGGGTRYDNPNDAIQAMMNIAIETIENSDVECVFNAPNPNND